jgi:hypothetical protein
MRAVKFKDFIKDYKEYYSDNSEIFTIRTRDDMQEILYEIYNTEDFEIDYDRKLIELY